MIDQQKRQRIILAIIGIVVVLAAWTLYGLTTTGRLTITAPATTPNNSPVEVTIYRGSTKDAQLTIQPGKSATVTIGSGLVRVDSAADTMKAVDIVKIGRFYSSSNLTAPTGKNHATEQLASNVQPCAVVNNGVTYSYGCEADTQIIRHNSNSIGGSLGSAMFNNLSFSMLKPVNNNLIGMYSSPNNPGELLSIDLASETITPLKFSDEINALLADNYPYISTATDSSNSHFALSFLEKKKTYIFDSISDTTPTVAALPEETKPNNSGRLFSADFHNDTFVAYLGISSDIGEGETSEVAQPDPDIPCYVIEYDKQGKLTNTYELPQDTTIHGFFKLNNDFYLAETEYSYALYQLNGGQLEQIYDLTDGGSWTTIQGKTYIQIKGTIHELIPAANGLFSLHSVFSSSSITASELRGSNGSLLFTGFNNKENSETNVYRLLDEATADNGAGDAATDTQSRVEPTYINIDELLDYGTSADQLTNTRFALGKFAATQPKQINTIEVNNIRQGPWDPDGNNAYGTLYFGVLLNGQLKEARLETYDLFTSRLYLTELDGTQLYDSGSLNSKQPRNL